MSSNPNSKNNTEFRKYIHAEVDAVRMKCRRSAAQKIAELNKKGYRHGLTVEKLTEKLMANYAHITYLMGILDYSSCITDMLLMPEYSIFSAATQKKMLNLKQAIAELASDIDVQNYIGSGNQIAEEYSDMLEKAMSSPEKYVEFRAFVRAYIAGDVVID